MPNNYEKLVGRINSKDWWHVPPVDPVAYRKRGKFYSSTYREAEFYGRPVGPERVTVHNPLIGDEEAISKNLGLPRQHADMTYAQKVAIDAAWKKKAIVLGYDSIALLSKSGFNLLRAGKLPRSIELNVF